MFVLWQRICDDGSRRRSPGAAAGLWCCFVGRWASQLRVKRKEPGRGVVAGREKGRGERREMDWAVGIVFRRRSCRC